tara:strand:+ start:44 stop:535 length:492 start_codon:yes stop_codon:yes gene_type:complete
MKLKLIQEEKLFSDVTNITFDNVFSADYLDYVITSHDGLGTVSSNALRFLDSSGNERSTSEYQIHQIYGTNSAENYQNSSDQNKYFDAFWKYGDGVNISIMIHNPFDENQQTLLSAFGNANQLFFDASGVYNESERHRGFKLIQATSTTYYNTGILSIYGIEY